MTVYLGSTVKTQYFDRKTRTKKTVVKLVRRQLSFVGVVFWLGLILVGLVLWYVFNINRIATFGYNIKITEKKIQELKNKNDNLKIKSSELKSVETLELKATDIGMINPSEIDYLNVVEGLALKK